MLVCIDIGISDAKDYWNKIVIPALDEFQRRPSAQTGMASASSLWHIHEWVWYDKHPKVNTWGSKAYKAFPDYASCSAGLRMVQTMNIR